MMRMEEGSETDNESVQGPESPTPPACCGLSPFSRRRGPSTEHGAGFGGREMEWVNNRNSYSHKRKEYAQTPFLAPARTTILTVPLPDISDDHRRLL